MFLAGDPPEASAVIARGADLLCRSDDATFVSPVARDLVWVAGHLTTVRIMSGGMTSQGVEWDQSVVYD